MKVGNKGFYTTFPLPPADAEQLAALMQEHGFAVEPRPEGSQVVLAYAPPPYNPSYENPPPTLQQLLNRLPGVRKKAGGGSPLDTSSSGSQFRLDV